MPKILLYVRHFRFFFLSIEQSPLNYCVYGSTSPTVNQPLRQSRRSAERTTYSTPVSHYCNANTTETINEVNQKFRWV